MIHHIMKKNKILIINKVLKVSKKLKIIVKDKVKEEMLLKIYYFKMTIL